MAPQSSILCIAYLFASFVVAGVAQTLWFKSPLSRPFRIPLDGGRSFRGKRILGDNKTLSGFFIMVPATAIAFLLVSALFRLTPTGHLGLWEMSAGGHVLLGAWAGFWFMVGELPNSFFKRQFGIAPGQPAPQGWRKTLCFVFDQVDSVLAALIAIACVVPVSFVVWFAVLALGGFVHWLFNVVLMLIDLKARAA